MKSFQNDEFKIGDLIQYTRWRQKNGVIIDVTKTSYVVNKIKIIFREHMNPTYSYVLHPDNKFHIIKYNADKYELPKRTNGQNPVAKLICLLISEYRFHKDDYHFSEWYFEDYENSKENRCDEERDDDLEEYYSNEH